MVSSNQSLFPYSLADIQDSSSHISYFHTKSKTLLENNKTKGVNNLSLKYIGTFVSLPGPGLVNPNQSLLIRPTWKGYLEIPYCKPTRTEQELDNQRITDFISNFSE